MANNPTTMLALPFYVSGARTLYITNDLTASVTAVTIPQGYYANFLVNSSSSDGTQANPYDVISEFNKACGQYFDFSLNEDGKTKITYRGIVSGTLSFVSSTLAKNILGFNTISISFSSGSSITSSYQPYGTVFTFGATNDTSWNRQFSSTGYSGLPDGRVYGFKDDYVKFTRKTDLRFHPYSQVEKELLTSNTATPVHQISKSLWGQPPSLLDSTYEQPYTLDHFLYESPGVPVREARSTLQQHLANTDNKFDIVYIDPETIGQENQYQPSIANYSKILDLKDLKVSLYQSAIRMNRTNPTNLTGSFTPSDLSGLQLWLRSDDLIQANGTVSQVNDKSGNGRHAVQAVSSSQPYYFANGGLNNLPYWQGFSAASSGRYLLAGANGDFDFMHNGTDWTLIYIAAGPTLNSCLVMGTQQASANNIGFSVWEYTSPGASFYMGNNTTTVISKTQTTGFNSGSWNTAILKYTDSATPALSGVLNTTIETTANKAATPTATSSGRKFGIGSSGTGQFSSNTKFAEVIIYNKTLTAGEISQIQDYIFDRYVATPADLPGLSVWYQADDIVLSASKISQFNDKSGNDRHATNSNATYQVTQSIDAAYNSKTIAVTNGSANQVYTPTSFTVSQPLTAFAIGDGNGTFGADWETWLDSANANRIILRMNQSHYFAAYAGSANVDLTSTVNSKTTPSIAWCEYNGASSKGNVNSATATTLASNPGTNSLTQPILLTGYAGGYPIANGGKFAATLVFNRQLSTTERNFVLSYFSSYYGITVSGI